jgi:hypothetical protein
LIALAVVGFGVVASASAASAHGFSSTAYVDLAATDDGTVVAELDLEYDLLVVSAAENEDDDDFFQEGMDLFETGEEATALRDHSDTVLAYIDHHFGISAAGGACTPTLAEDPASHIRDDVPYGTFILSYDCEVGDGGYEMHSTLFPDDEGYVTDAKTIVTYDFGEGEGSVVLDSAQSSWSSDQPFWERLGEFFILGAEHLLFGIDHILFLLVLIVGSWRLREVVLAATAFTIAHSLTFLLAALGVVNLPAAIVEPIIALSIAVVAGWYLWGAWRRRKEPALELEEKRGLFGLTRPALLRLIVVFVFGLIHGLGFAGALGIDEPWSWTLLASLLVFNVGIEAVQLAIIAIVFPLLMLLRRHRPRLALWLGVALAAAVALIALVWFVQRVLGIE